MRKGLRVLHVVPSVGPLRGGPSLMVLTMARGLARAGLDVHIATTDDNGPERLAVPLGVPIDGDGVVHWYFRRQTRPYTFSWPLARWLAERVPGYDLVHVHALFSWASAPAAWLAARRSVPYVVRPLGTLNRWGMTRRRPRLKRLSFRLLERRILAAAARIHFTTEQERVEAEELGIVGRAAVVPLGVDLAGLEPLPGRGWLARRAPHLAGRVTVLFLSRLDAKKGLDLLLPAIARLNARRDRVALVVAGSGSPQSESWLRREAGRLGIERHLLWAGFLDGDEKLAALADAAVFVLPSHSENFGVAVVEAMACGLPVVVSDQVGVHREVAAAGAGLVVPCREEPLAAAIGRLAGDPDLRRVAGERGRQLARERFSVEAMTAGVMRMYEEALDWARAAAC